MRIYCGVEPVLGGSVTCHAVTAAAGAAKATATVGTAHSVLAKGGFKGYETSLPRPRIALPRWLGLPPGTSRDGIPATSNS